MTKYDKLVRDKVLEKLDKKRLRYKSHVASDEEYGKRLDEKPLEEAKEYLESRNPEELADMLQAIYDICKYREIKFSEIELIRTNKFRELGGFEKRIILEEVEE